MIHSFIANGPLDTNRCDIEWICSICMGYCCGIRHDIQSILCSTTENLRCFTDSNIAAVAPDGNVLVRSRIDDEGTVGYGRGWGYGSEVVGYGRLGIPGCLVVVPGSRPGSVVGLPVRYLIPKSNFQPLQYASRVQYPLFRWPSVKTELAILQYASRDPYPLFRWASVRWPRTGHEATVRLRPLPEVPRLGEWITVYSPLLCLHTPRLSSERIVWSEKVLSCQHCFDEIAGDFMNQLLEILYQASRWAISLLLVIIIWHIHAAQKCLVYTIDAFRLANRSL